MDDRCMQLCYIHKHKVCLESFLVRLSKCLFYLDTWMTVDVVGCDSWISNYTSEGVVCFATVPQCSAYRSTVSVVTRNYWGLVLLTLWVAAYRMVCFHLHQGHRWDYTWCSDCGDTVWKYSTWKTSFGYHWGLYGQYYCRDITAGEVPPVLWASWSSYMVKYTVLKCYRCIQGGHKPAKPGILWEFCATSGKNCNKLNIFSSSFRYLCKTAGNLLYCWSWCGMTLGEGHYYIYFFVAIMYGKVSLWLWKSLENSGNFFLLLCGHPGVFILHTCFINLLPPQSPRFYAAHSLLDIQFLPVFVYREFSFISRLLIVSTSVLRWIDNDCVVWQCVEWVLCMCAAAAWSAVAAGASWRLGNSTHRIYAWTWVSAVPALWLFTWWRCVQSVDTNSAASSHSWQRKARVMCCFFTDISWSPGGDSPHSGVLWTS